MFIGFHHQDAHGGNSLGCTCTTHSAILVDVDDLICVGINQTLFFFKVRGVPHVTVLVGVMEGFEERWRTWVGEGDCRDVGCGANFLSDWRHSG